MSITYGIYKLIPPIPRGDCISAPAVKWAELVGNQSVLDAGTYSIAGLPGVYDALRFEVDYRQSNEANPESKIEVFLIPPEGSGLPLDADGHYRLDVRPWQSVYYNRFCMGNYNLPTGQYMFHVNISGEPTQFIRFGILNDDTTQPPRICTEGDFRCDSAGNLQQCLNNSWTTLWHCEHGCTTGGCLPPSGSIDENFYRIFLYCDKNPPIPGLIKDMIRKVATAAGWTIGIIEPEPGVGYRIHAVKNGSLALVIVIGSIIAILAAFKYLSIREYRIVRVSDNYTEQVTAISETISQALEYCTQNGLTPEECAAIVTGVQQIYGELPPPGEEPPGGINETIKYAALAVVAVFALSALKK